MNNPPAGSSIRSERLSHKQGVPGSSPGQPTIFFVSNYAHFHL